MFWYFIAVVVLVIFLEKCFSWLFAFDLNMWKDAVCRINNIWKCMLEDLELANLQIKNTGVHFRMNACRLSSESK